MGYGDWVGGWRGYTGYPATLLEEGPSTSGAGPGGPAGAGVGGLQEPDVPRAGDGSWTTLRARSVYPVALPVQDP